MTIPAQNSHPEARVALAELAGNAATVDALRAIQKRGYALLDKNINELSSTLGREDPLNSAVKAGTVIDVRRLATASRQSSEGNATRRTFARNILVAGLLNRNNEGWDMTDPTSWQSDPDDLIVALMGMPPLP